MEILEWLRRIAPRSSYPSFRHPGELSTLTIVCLSLTTFLDSEYKLQGSKYKPASEILAPAVKMLVLISSGCESR